MFPTFWHFEFFESMGVRFGVHFFYAGSADLRYGSIE